MQSSFPARTRIQHSIRARPASVRTFRASTLGETPLEAILVIIGLAVILYGLFETYPLSHGTGLVTIGVGAMVSGVGGTARLGGKGVIIAGAAGFVLVVLGFLAPAFAAGVSP